MHENALWLFGALSLVCILGGLNVWLILSLRRQAKRREELRGADEPFRTLFELVPFSCTLTSRDGRYIAVNKAFAEAVGITPEQAVGRTNAELGISIEERHEEEVREQLWRDGKAGNREATVSLKGGGVRHLLYNVTRVEVDGQPAYLTASVDISNAKRAELALRERAETFRALAENAPDVILRFDRELRHIYVNPAIQGIMGVAPEAFLGKTFEEVGVPPERCRQWNDAIRQVFASGEAHRLELNMPGGRWADWLLAPEFDDKGNVQAVLTSARDITDRRTMESALRESERRYRTIFESSSDAVFIMRDDKFVDCNAATLEIFGCRSRNEIIGRSPFEFSPVRQPDGRHTSGLGTAHILAAKEGKHQAFEWVHQRADGTPFYAEVTLDAIEIEQESLLLAVVRDITNRKHAENTLRHNAECARVLLALNQMDDVAEGELVIFVLQEMVRLTRSETGFIAFLQEDESLKSLHVWPQDGAAPGGASEAAVGLYDDRHPWRDVPGARQAVMVNEHPEGGGRDEGVPSIRRHVSVPVFQGAQVVLAAGVANCHEAYTDADVQELTLLMEGLWRIVEGRRAQQVLRESEARFQSLFELAPVSLAYVSLSGNIIHANRRLLDLVGYRLDEVADYDSWRLQAHPDPEYRAWAMADWQQAVEEAVRHEGRVEPREYRITCKDGKTRTMLIGANVLGEYLLVSFVDISERKDVEDSLQHRDKQLQNQNDTLFELMMSGNIFLRSLQDAIAEITEACGRLLGVGRTSVWLYAEDNSVIRCVDLYELNGNRHSSGEELQTVLFPSYMSAHQRGQAIVAEDVFTDPRTKEIPQSYYKRNGVCSLLDVPIWLGERVHGLLSFEATGKPRRWTPEDERLANSMATLITLGFEIAERKRTEAELRESKRRYEQAVAATTDAIWEWDLNTGKTYYSPRWFEMLGYEENEFEMSIATWSNLCHPDDFGHAMDSVISTLNTLERTHYEVPFRMLAKDGSWKWIMQRGSVVKRDENGLPLLVSGTNTDFTERQKVMAERERLMAAIEQSGEIIVITDRDGTIEYVNQAFENVTGYTRKDAIGQNPRILKSGVQNEGFYRDLWVTISSGRTWQGQLVNRRKDGSFYTEAATISPVRDLSGRICNYVSAKSDITEHLKLEAQLQQAQKMESIGRLAGGVAHDYNNMLGVIIGYTELALEKLEPESPILADLEEVQKAAVRSMNITRQLLTFARKQAIVPRVLDLNETIEGMLKMLRRLIGEDVDLNWRPASGLGPVNMDPAQVDQLLANLCVNARDAIENTGVITIETSNVVFDASDPLERESLAPGEYVLLAVSDTGCGMTKETMAQIFDPFFTTKGVGQGTGLGLATVYGIVRQNNGSISVYSEVGQGTTFKIFLPKHVGVRVAEDASALATPPMAAGETILLVEDEAALLRMGHAILRKLGYTVLPASSPREALRLAHEHATGIDLLMTDVVMPEMSGRELAEAVVAINPAIKCLYMSGYTADAIANKGVLNAGVDFIQKPFSLRDLAFKINAALHRQ